MNKLKLLIVLALAACSSDKECITGPIMEIPGIIETTETIEIPEEIEPIMETEGIPPEIVIESSGSGTFTFQHF